VKCGVLRDQVQGICRDPLQGSPAARVDLYLKATFYYTTNCHTSNVVFVSLEYEWIYLQFVVAGERNLVLNSLQNPIQIGTNLSNGAAGGSM
jgi:hypothetical protein